MSSFFFFNDTATTEIYTLSLHDALPILMVSALDAAKTAVQALQLGAADYLVKGFELDELRQRVANLLKLATLEKENDALRRRMATEGQFGQMIGRSAEMRLAFEMADRVAPTDRKSTRLNSSHSQISYAVFCLKKKKKSKRT